MNKLLSSSRCALLASAVATMGLVSAPLALAESPRVAIRQVDYVVALVNSEPITNGDVQLLRQRLEAESASRGAKIDVEELNRVALEQLINQKAQLQQARDTGIKITDDAVDQAELNIAASNQLTLDQLHQRLAQEGMSASDLRDQLRKQLTLSRLRERDIESRIRISDADIQNFLRDQLQAQMAQMPPQLNLGMILIAVPENSSAEATKLLEERAQLVVTKARQGEAFETLAKTYSQAQGADTNGGTMGLRPEDRYPELFVNAARQMQTGEVSNPVRSPAGFHILKLIERQTIDTLRVVQTRPRHILLRPTESLSQAQAVEKLSAVRKAIVQGEAKFEDKARELSQDGSAAQGGDLGWANPGMFVPEFEQVMNQLRPGQVAPPVISRFGVHLIEVTDRRTVPMSDKDQRTMAEKALRAQKLEEGFTAWAEDVRGRAYVEMREPPR